MERDVLTKMEIGKESELLNLMSKYVDNSDTIDISKFRLENRAEYTLLPYYFGGVNAAIERGGWVKISKTKDYKFHRGRWSRSGSEIATLQSRLAYDMIKTLRNQNTLEEIGDHYKVSRAAINQLYKALKSKIDPDLPEKIDIPVIPKESEEIIEGNPIQVSNAKIIRDIFVTLVESGQITDQILTYLIDKQYALNNFGGMKYAFLRAIDINSSIHDQVVINGRARYSTKIIKINNKHYSMTNDIYPKNCESFKAWSLRLT